MFEYQDVTTRPDTSVPFWFELPEANTQELTAVKHEFMESGALVYAGSQISADLLTLTRKFILRSRQDFDAMIARFQEQNPGNYDVRKRYNAEHLHTVASSIKESP